MLSANISKTTSPTSDSFLLSLDHVTNVKGFAASTPINARINMQTRTAQFFRVVRKLPQLNT